MSRRRRPSKLSHLRWNNDLQPQVSMESRVVVVVCGGCGCECGCGGGASFATVFAGLACILHQLRTISEHLNRPETEIPNHKPLSAFSQGFTLQMKSLIQKTVRRVDTACFWMSLFLGSFTSKNTFRIVRLSLIPQGLQLLYAIYSIQTRL